MTVKRKFHLARHVRRVESMHLPVSSLSNSTAGHDELDWLHSMGVDSTPNLVCCIICIKLWYVSYSLIYWSIDLFYLFYLTEQIGFVYVRA